MKKDLTKLLQQCNAYGDAIMTNALRDRVHPINTEECRITPSRYKPSFPATKPDSAHRVLSSKITIAKNNTYFTVSIRVKVSA